MNSFLEEQEAKFKQFSASRVIPFGKYKNKLVSSVPSSYIVWMFENAIETGNDCFFTEEEYNISKETI